MENNNEMDVINNPKNIFARLVCKHEPHYCRKIEPFFNLSGERQYKICSKCGKRMGERFIKYD